MVEQKELRILCFGNSLTVGYYDYGISEHPYAARMKEVIENALSDIDVQYVVNGVPGDLVVHPGRFLSRIENDCSKETKWDWVIFLGGTNDLGYGKTPDAIYAGLQKSWNVALDSGANVLALTVPEAAARVKGLRESRSKLNELILSHKAERFHAFDLCQKIPYFSSTPEFIKEIFFDDGLHLTPSGYDYVGQVIGEHLVGLLDEGGHGEPGEPGELEDPEEPQEPEGSEGSEKQQEQT